MIEITVICHRLKSKTRLHMSTFCTKRLKNPTNLVTSPKINTRLAHPMVFRLRPDFCSTLIIVLIS